MSNGVRIKKILTVVNIFIIIVSIIMGSNLVNNKSLAETLSTTEPAITIDQGNYRRITGKVLDKDGKPWPGITVKLIDSNSTEVAKVISSGVGTYEFLGIKPGNYRIKYENCDVTKVISKQISYKGSRPGQNLNIAFVMPKDSKYVPSTIIDEIKAKLKSKNIGISKTYYYDNNAYYIENEALTRNVGNKIYEDMLKSASNMNKDNKLVIINLLDRISPAVSADFGWISSSNDDDGAPVCFYTATLGYNNALNTFKNIAIFSSGSRDYFFKTTNLQELVEQIAYLKIGEINKFETELNYINDKTSIITVEEENDNYNTGNIVTYIAGIRKQEEVKPADPIEPPTNTTDEGRI